MVTEISYCGGSQQAGKGHVYELSRRPKNFFYLVLGGGHRGIHGCQNLKTIHSNHISIKKVVKKKFTSI